MGIAYGVKVGTGTVELGVGCDSVLVSIAEGVRLGSIVAVAVGIAVFTPQAANCIASVKMMNKNGVWFIFIARPNW